jgi:hypothetical protein
VGKPPDDYEPVQDRIAKFWADHPDGRILTDLVYRDDKQYIVRAEVWRKPTIYANGEVVGADATGYAEEVVGSTHVNKTNALENAETSAIGRALANMGYATKVRPSKEEMQKVDRANKADTARKVLLEFVDSHKLDRAKVAHAFLLTHKIPLHQHPNADAIIGFGRALAADPEKTLNPELPPEARDDARRD